MILRRRLKCLNFILLLGAIMTFIVYAILSTGDSKHVSWKPFTSVKETVRSALDPETGKAELRGCEGLGSPESGSRQQLGKPSTDGVPHDNKVDRFEDRVQEDTGQPDLDQEEIIRSRLADRVQRLDKICNATHKNSPPLNSSVGHTIVDDRLLHCMIPKVGTQFIMDLRKRLSKKPVTVYNGPKKKYVVVREPYSRMVSGYIDKMVLRPDWWKNFGAGIISYYRKNASALNKKCGNNVLFPEFITYVIGAQTNGRKKNVHFTPISEHCFFCRQRYDYVVHLETFKEDISYIYKTVNISVNIDYGDEELTSRGKCKWIVNQLPTTKECEDAYVTLGKYWWSLQARGFIADNMSLPCNGTECETITGQQFADLAWKAHLNSVGHIDRRKQKRETLVKLFLQVPLEDRMRIRDLYREDFDMFGYDPEPADLFPELHLARSSHF